MAVCIYTCICIHKYEPCISWVYVVMWSDHRKCNFFSERCHCSCSTLMNFSKNINWAVLFLQTWLWVIWSYIYLQCCHAELRYKVSVIRLREARSLNLDLNEFNSFAFVCLEVERRVDTSRFSFQTEVFKVGFPQLLSLTTSNTDFLNLIVLTDGRVF